MNNRRALIALAAAVLIAMLAANIVRGITTGEWNW